MVPPKEPKPSRGRGGLRTWDTSVTRSEETHASSTHEDEEEGNTGEGDPSLKGKRAASEDNEEDVQPKGLKWLRKSSTDPAGKRSSPEKITLSDESDGDLFQPKRKKPAPRR